MGCCQSGCANYTEGLFPLCNLYLVWFLSLHGLLPLRALIDDNHSNLLVVFLGLTLLGLRVIAIGHLSQKHPLWLAIWQERGWGYFIFSVFPLGSAGDMQVVEWVSYVFAGTGERSETLRSDKRTETWGNEEVIGFDGFFLTPTCRCFFFFATRKGANYTQTEQHPKPVFFIVFLLGLLFASRAATRLQLLLLIGNVLLIHVCCPKSRTHFLFKFPAENHSWRRTSLVESMRNLNKTVKGSADNLLLPLIFLQIKVKLCKSKFPSDRQRRNNKKTKVQ